MPNIYRFLIKTLCVFGVTFTLTLPHNNAWGEITCCECKTRNSCQTPNGIDCTGNEYSHSTYGYCEPGDQLWCENPECEGKLIYGMCFDGWKECATPENPNPGEGPKSCDGCINQHTVSSGYDGTHCELYGVGNETVPNNYTFTWTYMNYNPGDHCYGTSEQDQLYSANCNTEDLYYQVGSDVDCAIKFSSSQWRVGTCHGCSSEPCYDCDDVSDGFWVNGCGIDEQYPRKAITCDTPENCGYTDPSDPMYQKITETPNVYVRVLEYTFSKSDGNGSCTINWLDIIDCVLGYYYIEETKTCEPCPIGYIGDTISDGSLFYWWRATCTPCSTGESTFSTKTIDGKTVIDKLLNAQVREDSKTTAPCTKCPKGYKWEKYTDTSLPVYQETYICVPCPEGQYGDTEGATDCKNCSDIVKKGDSPFTSDKPDSSKGLINDSIQMCYIDPNVMLSDSLGKIKLSEEIGSGTKLYHQ